MGEISFLVVRLPYHLRQLVPTVRMVDFVIGRYGRDNPRILVGQRDGNDIGMPPLPHLDEPGTFRILFVVSLTKCGAHAMDHQGAQIALAELGDAE